MAQIGAALDNPTPAPTMAEPGERVRGQHDDGDEPFPLDCPVIPLGAQSTIDGSQKCYYLNVNGEIVGLESGNKHGKGNLAGLFGHKVKYLESQWGRYSDPKKEYSKVEKRWIEVEPPRLIGFDQGKASIALISECSRRGIFDPAGRLRGRGAHALTGGGLVLHLGDAVAALVARADGKLSDLSWHDTGLHQRFVYPAGAPLSRPWAQSVGPAAAITIAERLKRWNWKRPDLDPILLLGAIGQGFIGGALSWRSNVWITGPRGTGKSALNGREGLVPGLYGDMVFRTANTSAAAIRQSLKNSTVPVMIDEAEPGKDSRAIDAVVELARVASSGDKVHRGGQDHNATEFTLQSPFWFSSINIPAMEAADRSRLAILELRPLSADAKPLEPLPLADLGRKLFRRMMDGWPMLAECKRRFHVALIEAGHDSRAADQFGGLLACAHVLLNDEVCDDEDVADWAQHCRPQRMAEVNDQLSDEDACINHLQTALVQPRGRDSREAVSELVARWVAKSLNPEGLTDDTRGYVEQLGLKVVNPVYRPADGAKPARWGSESLMPHAAPGYLAVASTHQALNAIFAGTKWQNGVWKQTLARVEGAVEVAAVSFARAKIRAVLIPLYTVIDERELPDLSKRDAARAWLAEQTQGPEA
ncbi:hypothetical protein [Novosphingobium sp. FKTRR1]|uniref:hypothetical protein n=1 Tax=Novosphingobium sp. FKTRR1 TaxID=2879118 RepID=UPI001CF07250|nr:hypothetical protein [Novosphingobium sp. FKTRR1]